MKPPAMPRETMRDLVRRVGVRQHVPDERVAGLVVGDDLASLFGVMTRLLRSGPGDDAVDGLVELGHR